jgi:K+-sensing histidine kinase KdpD
MQQFVRHPTGEDDAEVVSADDGTSGPDGEPLHAVRFYPDDDDLIAAVTQFFETGLARGERVAVIASPAHCHSFLLALRARGMDVERMLQLGRLLLRDADQTLAQIMVGGMPDRSRFRMVVGELLDSGEPRGHAARPVRAFGEMVDLLWRAGNRPAAIALEEMWNDLQRERSFALLCAYSAARFSSAADGLQRVCATHNHLLDGANGATDEAANEVQVLAQQLVQGKQAERALVREAERNERLLQITAAIADAVTPEQVYQAVVDQVAVALRASSAALWVMAEDGSTVALTRSVGYPEQGRRRFDAFKLDTGESFPALDALRTGAPVWIDSQAELLERYPQLGAVVTPGRSYRVSCLPVVARGQTLGAVGFTFEGDSVLDGQENAFLLLVARYTSQALERLRLLDAERKSREQAEAAAVRMALLSRENELGRLRAELLYGLAATVNGSDRVEQVFEAALDAIERALGTSRASILAFDADGVMRFKAYRGLSAAYRSAVEGHSPWSRDTRDPAPVLVPDAERDASLGGYHALFRQERIAALAFIPLVASGKLLGKFMVYYERPRALQRYELELATAIAHHVAAALHRFAAMGELQETVRFNEMFAGVLGHDLRNPLAAIMTAAHVLGQRADSDRVRRPLARIVSSGDRMARMIDQLLDFTRVRVGGGIGLSRDRFDLVPLLRQVIDELDDANPGWTLRLVHDGDTHGVWDSDRLLQAFSNLVANAVQHGDRAHGVTVRVDATSADFVRVDVHNMGAVPEALAPKLFEPMTGGERRQGARGLGLGLYITREILKAHGGSIELRSSEHEGTTFTALLPKASSAEGSVAP